MGQITAVIIMKNGHFLGACNTPQALNCQNFVDSPRKAWLSNLSYCCGGDEGYKLTFTKPADDPNALKGTFVVESGIGKFIDGDIEDVIAKCGECCGEDVDVTPFYNGVFPSPVAPLAKTYTIVRADAGDLLATERFMVDYMKYIIDGTWLKTGYSGGNSTYVFQSYKDPIAHGSDAITETARVIESNVAPSLIDDEVFTLTGNADGVDIDVTGTATLSAFPAILQANAVTGPMGTWSMASSKIRLTTTVVDYATLVLGKVDPTP